MKKSVAIIIAICMLMSLLPIGMVWATEAAAPTLLFELAISGVEGEGVKGTTTTVAATAATQGNLQSGSSLSIESITSGHTDPPVYHQEGSVKYLTFARDVLENTATDEVTGEKVGTGTYSYTKEDSRIVVPMAHSLDIANKDALTFETWIRPVRDTRVTGQKGDYNRVFSFGSARGIDDVNPHKNLFEFNWMVRNTSYGGPRFDNDNQNADANDQNSFYSVTASGDTTDPINGYMDEFDNTWMHLVITREWTAVTETTGTWTNKLYINGAYRGSKTGATSTRSVITTGTPGNPMNHLCIGGYTNSAEAFRGDISTFKMYDGVLPEATVRSNYEAARDTYFPANGRKVFSMDIKDDGTGVAATADSTSAGVMLDNSLSGSYTLPTRMVEDGVEFLRFASLDATTGNLLNPTAQVTVRLNDYEISDEENITVEAWVRPDYTVNADATGTLNSSERMALFSVGRHPKFVNTISGSTAVKDAYRVQFETGAFADETPSYGTMVFSNKTDRGEKATLADLSAHDGQWHHYAVTRTWTSKPTETYPNNGTWSHKLYVDGVLYAEGSVNAMERYDYSQLAYEGRANHNTADYLAIGGTVGGVGNSAFHGDIATFSLYAGELNATDVSKLYKSGLRIFNPGELGAEFTNQADEALTSLNIAAATEVKVEALEIEEYTSENAPFAVLAVYKGNELVKCKIVTTSVDTETDTATISASAISGITAGGIDDVKLFVWDSVSNVRPLFKASCL